MEKEANVVCFLNYHDLCFAVRMAININFSTIFEWYEVSNHGKIHTYLSKIEKDNVRVVIVGNEMHAQSIVPWRSRNEKKFNRTIKIITFIASSKIVDANKKCLAII